MQKNVITQAVLPVRRELLSLSVTDTVAVTSSVRSELEVEVRLLVLSTPGPISTATGLGDLDLSESSPRLIGSGDERLAAEVVEEDLVGF